jgi:hypothetical protein
MHLHASSFVCECVVRLIYYMLCNVFYVQAFCFMCYICMHMECEMCERSALLFASVSCVVFTTCCICFAVYNMLYVLRVCCMCSVVYYVLHVVRVCLACCLLHVLCARFVCVVYACICNMKCEMFERRALFASVLCVLVTCLYMLCVGARMLVCVMCRACW